jgi:hypothetical protein
VTRKGQGQESWKCQVAKKVSLKTTCDYLDYTSCTILAVIDGQVLNIVRALITVKGHEGY